MEGVMKLLMRIHAGMSEDELRQTVVQWADTATHPETGMRYVDMVYQAMLQFTASGEGPRLMSYIHHTDDVGEYAYDRDSHICTFGLMMDEAITKGWIIVVMENDWNVIYPEP